MREVAPDVRTNSAEGLRLFLLVLDDVSAAGGTDELAVVDTVKQIARAFIDRLGPLDQACVLFTGDNRRSLDFTSDRQALLDSVEQVPRDGGAAVSARCCIRPESSRRQPIRWSPCPTGARR